MCIIAKDSVPPKERLWDPARLNECDCQSSGVVGGSTFPTVAFLLAFLPLFPSRPHNFSIPRSDRRLGAHQLSIGVQREWRESRERVSGGGGRLSAAVEMGGREMKLSRRWEMKVGRVRLGKPRGQRESTKRALSQRGFGACRKITSLRKWARAARAIIPTPPKEH